jgi:hypothetical protein
LYETPSRFLSGFKDVSPVFQNMSIIEKEFTAAGSVQDFHLIPFSAPSARKGENSTEIRGKDK